MRATLVAMLLCGCQVVAGVDDFEIQDPASSASVTSAGGTGAAGGSGGQGAGGGGQGGAGACPPWAARYGDDTEQVAVDVATDGCDVIVVGLTVGAIDFGGGPLPGTMAQDAFIARLGPGGEHVWSSRLGGPDDQVASSVAVASNGDVVAGGSFRGTVMLGGDRYTASIRDVLLTRFDGAGGLVDHARFGGPGAQELLALALDSNDRLALCGRFTGTTDFGGGPIVHAGGTGDDAFLAVLDAQGGHVLSERYGGMLQDACLDVAFDAGGNVVFAGTFAEAIDLGGGPLPSAGQADAFVAKLSPSGAHVFSRAWGDPGAQGMRAVAVDSAGNVIVAGFFTGSVDFGGGPLQSAGAADFVLVGLGPDGAHRYSVRFGDASAQCDQNLECRIALAVTPADEVLLAGHLRGTIDFGGDPLAAVDVEDVFVARFDADGNHLASARYGESGVQAALSVASDPFGRAVIGGILLGTADIGGTLLDGAGGPDALVARLPD
jgi:hypothetical protein